MIKTRTASWAWLLLAAALLTACGNSATGTPVPAGPAVSSSDSDGLPTGIPTDDGDTGAGGGVSGQNTMSPVDASVRVANTYVTLKGQQPTAIDIWAGTPTAGGRKLVTVPYGTVSDYFAPLVPNPSQSEYFTLNFYPAGATSEDDSLGSENETAAAGLKLTLLVAPVDPTQANTGSLGTSFHPFTDAVSTKPGSGFTTRSLPTPASGKAVLLLDAEPLLGRAGITGNGLTPSGTDGKCLPYYETNSAGSGYSSTLHDMSSDTVDTFGGTGGKPYQVSPGTQVRINQLKNDEQIPDACADKPVVGPFDPKLAAGQGAYGILYGTDLAHAKILLIPVG